MNPPAETLKPTRPGYDKGLKAATAFNGPQCPFPAGSPEASAWGDGVLDGRKNLAWNVRNAVVTGTTARWISEIVSMDIGVVLGKSLIPFGAEMLIYFRIGFVLADQDIQIPIMSVDDWNGFAKLINRALKGLPLDPSEEHWLDRLAWEEARSFVMTIVGGKFAPEKQVEENPRIEADLRTVIAWLGKSSGEIPYLPPAHP